MSTPWSCWPLRTFVVFSAQAACFLGLLEAVPSSSARTRCYAAGGPDVEARSGDSALEFIQQVYLQNRELFSTFTCRFRVVEGRALERADALAGRLVNVVSKSGLWICDGADGRYELLCDQKSPPQRPTATKLDRKGIDAQRHTTIPCLSLVELYSGGTPRRVGLSGVFDIATLEAGAGFTAVLTPLSLGVMGRGEQYSPARVIRGARQGKLFCRHAGPGEVDGVAIDVVEFDFKASPEGAPYCTWYLDVRRGCLPLKTVYKKGREANVTGETIATAIRACDNGGYICERAVSISPSAEGLDVTIVELLSLDLSKPPRDALALSLPPGTRVADRSDLRSTFALRNAESLRLDDFEMWRERCRGILNSQLEIERRRTSGANVSEHKAIRLGVVWIYLAFVGVVLSALTIWFWTRHR